MPELGSSKFTLRVAGDKFKSGMTQAKGHADKTTKGIGKSFSNLQGKIQGAAGKVPVIGGALAGLATPAGLATAGIGLVVGGMAKMVSKSLDVGRRLGELREKLGVSAESIQIYERAIEEGNGNTAAFEKTTLRLQKSIGDAAGGNKLAAAEFAKLGLSFEDLANKSPEEALKAVLGAANDTLEPTDRASTLALTLGKSYADLGGFATKGSDELTAMLDGVKDVAVTMSGDGVTAVDNYDTAMRDIRDTMSGVATNVGTALIPIITKLLTGIKQAIPILKETFTPIWIALKEVWLELQPALAQLGTTLTKDLLPALKKMWNAISPVLIPAIKIFVGLLLNRLVTTVKIVANAISGIAALLTGDFAGAWKSAQKVAQAVMNGLIGVYNNTLGRLPGVSKIDMVDFADNVGTSATAASDALSTAMDDSVTAVETAGGKIVQSEKDTSAGVADEHQARLEETKTFWDDMAKESADYRAAELTADLEQYDATDTEYKLALASLATMSAEHLAALQAGNDTASDHELAMMIIANRRYADEQKAADDAAALVAETVAADALAAEIAHRADLVAALDTHIGVIETAMEVADGDEKRALIAQLDDLKEDRMAAYAASKADLLAAKQAEIDEVREKIETAQGAELAALQAHQALLVVQYGTLAASINTQLDKIESPKLIDIVATIQGGASGGQRPGGPSRGPNGALFTQTNPDGSRQSGKPAPGPRNEESIAKDPISRVYTTADGTPFAFNTVGGSNTQFNIAKWGRLNDALAWLRENTPGAQHGALVRSRPGMGSLVRVGEGRQDEAILPLPKGMLNALRGGSGGMGGGMGSAPVYLSVKFGDTEVENVLVGKLDDLYRQRRINVDLTA